MKVCHKRNRNNYCVLQFGGPVCRTLSYYGISKYFLTDRKGETAHRQGYVRISMMKEWQKKHRITYRNFGRGVPGPSIIPGPELFYPSSVSL